MSRESVQNQRFFFFFILEYTSVQEVKDDKIPWNNRGVAL